MSPLRAIHIVHISSLNNIDRNTAGRVVEDVHSYTSIALALGIPISLSYHMLIYIEGIQLLLIIYF